MAHRFSFRSGGAGKRRGVPASRKTSKRWAEPIRRATGTTAGRSHVVVTSAVAGARGVHESVFAVRQMNAADCGSGTIHASTSRMFAHARILVADDDVELLGTIAAALERAGAEV